MLLRRVMLLFLALSLGVSGTLAAKELSDKDMKALTAVGVAFRAAAMGHDPKAMAALYAEDAVLMPPNAPASAGSDAILKFFEAFPKVTAIAFEHEVIQGADDWAWGSGHFTLTMEIGGASVEDSGYYLDVRRRGKDGAWKYVRDMFVSEHPLPDQN